MSGNWGKRWGAQGSAAPALNITSLMDMMTIILIFLLFCFSSQDQNIRMEKDIELPESSSEKPFLWAINVTMSQDQIKVEDELVCGLQDGKIIGLHGEQDRIVPLYNRLVELKAREQERDVQRDAAEPVVMFHADKRHRFETIYSIMKTAAMAGYPNFRFAVLKR